MAEAAGGDASSAGAKRGRARVAFTLAEKVALVRYARACTPTPTTTALVLWLEKKYEKKPDRSAVSRWLKNGSELLAAAEEANEHTLAAKKFRRSPQEELETKLFEWFNEAEGEDTEEDLTDDEVEEAPPVTLAAARAACDTLHAFALENARALGPDKERNLFYLQRTLRAMTTCAATRQSQLQSYFAPAPAPPKALRAARDADLGLDSESMELEQTGQDSTVL